MFGAGGNAAFAGRMDLARGGRHIPAAPDGHVRLVLKAV